MGSKSCISVDKFSGLIVNFCDYPIHYTVYGQLEERSTLQKTSGLNTATSIGASPSKASFKIAGIKDSHSQSMIYKELKGFVEVKPGHRSTLGLEQIIPQRHTITIQIQHPSDPKNNKIHYLVKDLIVMCELDVRLMILPDGTVRTMGKKEYQEQLRQLKIDESNFEDQERKLRLHSKRSQRQMFLRTIYFCNATNPNTIN